MKIFIYTVLFSILFSLFAKLQVYINYFANQSYYAQVLCENKDVKDACCAGKCAVEKELMVLHQKEETPPAKNNMPVLKISKAEQALCYSLSYFMEVAVLSLINTPYAAKTAGGNFLAVFKPPTVPVLG